MNTKLRKVEIQGFKSLDGNEKQSISLGDVTVLLGANGSGKSNLVSFFKMLNFMTTGALQRYVGRHGASRLLFYGPKRTESIRFLLDFNSNGDKDEYEVELSHGLPDRLFVRKERVLFHRRAEPEPQEFFLKEGGPETSLREDGRQTSEVLHRMLSGIRAFQFHDTSDTAKIKDRGYVDDARYLRSDAGNLAAFLKMLKGYDRDAKYYDRIVRHIRRVMPQFRDFDLEPIPGNDKYVRLNWRDVSSDDYLFGPDQLSDGSLRFMALATLLLQPPELLPSFIVLDEPELGLHPAAIVELAGMVRNTARKSQVLMATQSTRLVDEFSLAEIVVVEWDEKKNRSVFKDLDPESHEEWIERYSLSELWEKNVLGGQP
jgi:predicted ATPase